MASADPIKLALDKADNIELLNLLYDLRQLERSWYDDPPKTTEDRDKRIMDRSDYIERIKTYVKKANDNLKKLPKGESRAQKNFYMPSIALNISTATVNTLVDLESINAMLKNATYNKNVANSKSLIAATISSGKIDDAFIVVKAIIDKQDDGLTQADIFSLASTVKTPPKGSPKTSPTEKKKTLKPSETMTEEEPPKGEKKSFLSKVASGIGSFIGVEPAVPSTSPSAAGTGGLPASPSVVTGTTILSPEGTPTIVPSGVFTPSGLSTPSSEEKKWTVDEFNTDIEFQRQFARGELLTMWNDPTEETVKAAQDSITNIINYIERYKSEGLITNDFEVTGEFIYPFPLLSLKSKDRTNEVIPIGAHLRNLNALSNMLNPDEWGEITQRDIVKETKVPEIWWMNDLPASVGGGKPAKKLFSTESGSVESKEAPPPAPVYPTSDILMIDTSTDEYKEVATARDELREAIKTSLLEPETPPATIGDILNKDDIIDRLKNYVNMVVAFIANKRAERGVELGRSGIPAENIKTMIDNTVIGDDYDFFLFKVPEMGESIDRILQGLVEVANEFIRVLSGDDDDDAAPVLGQIRDVIKEIEKQMGVTTPKPVTGSAPSMGGIQRGSQGIPAEMTETLPGGFKLVPIEPDTIPNIDGFAVEQVDKLGDVAFKDIKLADMTLRQLKAYQDLLSALPLAERVESLYYDPSEITGESSLNPFSEENYYRNPERDRTNPLFNMTDQAERLYYKDAGKLYNTQEPKKKAVRTKKSKSNEYLEVSQLPNIYSYASRDNPNREMFETVNVVDQGYQELRRTAMRDEDDEDKDFINSYMASLNRF